MSRISTQTYIAIATLIATSIGAYATVVGVFSESDEINVRDFSISNDLSSRGNSLETTIPSQISSTRHQSEIVHAILVHPQDMKNARIFVDGEPAKIISQTPSFSTIEVDNHGNPSFRFEAYKDDKKCSARNPILNKTQKINLHCG